MAKSPSPGTTSSAILDSTELKVRLEEAAKIPIVQQVAQALGRKSDLHLVGGTVRDIAAGMPPEDIDLASRSTPEENLAHLAKAGIRAIETGIEHGTLTAVVDGVHAEITTYRTPGARTQSVYSSDIRTDLSGRDFTINAIAYALSAGEIIDPYNGLEDLRASLLRTVGDAETRFREDPLRIMRMVRFGPASGRALDPACEDAARKLTPLLAEVTVERIREELGKILTALIPEAGVRSMSSLGILSLLLPELTPMIGFEQNEFHTEDVFDHTMTVLSRCPPTEMLRLAGLFHDTGKPHTLSVGDDGRRHFYLHEARSKEICEAVMQRLRYSKDLTAGVSKLVQLHMRPLDCGPQGVRRIMRDCGEHFEAWLDLKRADSPPVVDSTEFEAMMARFLEMVQTEKDRLTGSVYGKLAVDGNDLMALGVKPGPGMGKILKRLDEIVIEDPEMNDRERLLAAAKEVIKESSTSS